MPLTAFVTLSNLRLDMITICPDIGGFKSLDLYVLQRDWVKVRYFRDSFFYSHTLPHSSRNQLFLYECRLSYMHIVTWLIDSDLLVKILKLFANIPCKIRSLIIRASRT